MMMRRASGILMPIFSLPNAQGIGTLGRCARDFADYVRECGCSYWQVLPLNPTGYGDSPYQSFSTFAGNPYLIDLEDLAELGLLERGELPRFSRGAVDYGRQYREKFRILRLAHSRAGFLSSEIEAFARENGAWLRDYALYMCLKEDLGGSWQDWPRGIREHGDPQMFVVAERYMHEENFWFFVQYLFFRQLRALKKYVNGLGLGLIGDMPIYVAMDSADTWSNRELFRFRGTSPTAVAGVPPDYFSRDGQLWGNPLYRWDVHKKRGFDWWIRRTKHLASMFDVIRLDHFRGFESYWSVPAHAPTAREGRWEKGPGKALFAALPKVPFLAEDLGLVTPEVRALVDDLGFPGMNVMQFAFDGSRKSPYLPHNHKKNSVSYLGTHDNDTTRGWLASLSAGELAYVREYAGGGELLHGLMRALFASPSDLVIVTMQDVLGMKKGRINTPATSSGNWRFRLPDDGYRKNTGRLAALNRAYSR